MNKIVSIVFVVALLATLAAAFSISLSYNVTAAITKTTADAQVQVGGGSLSNPVLPIASVVMHRLC
jgi:hypothetical protein